jgi:hypothetical protein
VFQWHRQQKGLESKLTAREDTIKTISTEKVELQEQQGPVATEDVYAHFGEGYAHFREG